MNNRLFVQDVWWMAWRHHCLATSRSFVLRPSKKWNWCLQAWQKVNDISSIQ